MKPLSLAVLALATLIAAPAAYASPMLPQVIYDNEDQNGDEGQSENSQPAEESDQQGLGAACGDGFHHENGLCAPD